MHVTLAHVCVLCIFIDISSYLASHKATQGLLLYVFEFVSFVLPVGSVTAVYGLPKLTSPRVHMSRVQEEQNAP